MTTFYIDQMDEDDLHNNLTRLLQDQIIYDSNISELINLRLKQGFETLNKKNQRKLVVAFDKAYLRTMESLIKNRDSYRDAVLKGVYFGIPF